MKKFLWLVILIVFAFTLAACGGNDPQIELETETLDLGEVVNGEIVTRNIVVKNMGSAELIVENVSTSCGCTQASLDSMTILPGENANLHIEFDSGAHGPELVGPLIRQIFIVSNDPKQPEATIELSTEVVLPST